MVMFPLKPVEEPLLVFPNFWWFCGWFLSFLSLWLPESNLGIHCHLVFTPCLYMTIFF